MWISSCNNVRKATISQLKFNICQFPRSTNTAERMTRVRLQTYLTPSLRLSIDDPHSSHLLFKFLFRQLFLQNASHHQIRKGFVRDRRDDIEGCLEYVSSGTYSFLRRRRDITSGLLWLVEAKVRIGRTILGRVRTLVIDHRIPGRGTPRLTLVQARTDSSRRLSIGAASRSGLISSERRRPRRRSSGLMRTSTRGTTRRGTTCDMRTVRRGDVCLTSGTFRPSVLGSGSSGVSS